MLRLWTALLQQGVSLSDLMRAYTHHCPLRWPFSELFKTGDSHQWCPIRMYVAHHLCPDGTPLMAVGPVNGLGPVNGFLPGTLSPALSPHILTAFSIIQYSNTTGQFGPVPAQSLFCAGRSCLGRGLEFDMHYLCRYHPSPGLICLPLCHYLLTPSPSSTLLPIPHVIYLLWLMYVGPREAAAVSPMHISRGCFVTAIKQPPAAPH